MNLSAAILMIRLVVGLLFVGHGIQKLGPYLGGHGVEGTSAMFEKVGIQPKRFWARIAATGEVMSGLLFAAGLLTPLAALVIVTVMAVAVVTVHGRNGLWITKGGFEYNLVLAVAAAAPGLFGAGRYSLDAVTGNVLSDPWTFVIGLVGAAVATMAATAGPRLRLPTSGRAGRGRAHPAA